MSIEAIFNRVMAAYDALRTTTLAEEQYVFGRSFIYRDYTTFTMGQSKVFLFDPTAFTGQSVVFQDPIFSATAGPVTIDFHTDVTANDDGTLLILGNRRYAFPAPVSVFRLAPTGVTLGTKVGGDIVPASSGGNAVGASSQPTLFVEVDHTKKFAYNITNTANIASTIGLKISWVEVPF